MRICLLYFKIIWLVGWVISRSALKRINMRKFFSDFFVVEAIVLANPLHIWRVNKIWFVSRLALKLKIWPNILRFFQLYFRVDQIDDFPVIDAIKLIVISCCSFEGSIAVTFWFLKLNDALRFFEKGNVLLFLTFCLDHFLRIIHDCDSDSWISALIADRY